MKNSRVLAFYRGPLSQWHLSCFSYGEVNYHTAEHYMMAEKARIFGDLETERKILSHMNPHMAKLDGRRVKGFDQDIWDELKEEVVYRGNLSKFSPPWAYWELLTLLSSGDLTLAEASEKDLVWGTGLNEKETLATPPERWPGQNLLGKALMRVREQLKGSPFSGEAWRDIRVGYLQWKKEEMPRDMDILEGFLGIQEAMYQFGLRQLKEEGRRNKRG